MNTPTSIARRAPHHPGQHAEQRALIGRHLHPRRPPGHRPRGGRQLTQHLVGRGAVGKQIILNDGRNQLDLLPGDGLRPHHPLTISRPHVTRVYVTRLHVSRPHVTRLYVTRLYVSRREKLPPDLLLNARQPTGVRRGRDHQHLIPPAASTEQPPPASVTFARPGPVI
ncbi:hypothetical protein [Nonomuraea salmonea]|uniref:hypothetical protein n=1 Tax=Nonomuraea salmonea TaxID=46181 RepID=UPI0031EEFFD2